MPPTTTPYLVTLRSDVLDALTRVCAQAGPRKRYGATAFEKYARTTIGRVCGRQAGACHDERQFQVALLSAMEAYEA